MYAQCEREIENREKWWEFKTKKRKKWKTTVLQAFSPVYRRYTGALLYCLALLLGADRAFNSVELSVLRGCHQWKSAGDQGTLGQGQATAGTQPAGAPGVQSQHIYTEARMHTTTHMWDDHMEAHTNPDIHAFVHTWTSVDTMCMCPRERTRQTQAGANILEFGRFYCSLKIMQFKNNNFWF